MSSQMLKELGGGGVVSWPSGDTVPVTAFFLICAGVWKVFIFLEELSCSRVLIREGTSPVSRLQGNAKV